MVSLSLTAQELQLQNAFWRFYAVGVNGVINPFSYDIHFMEDQVQTGDEDMALSGFLDTIQDLNNQEIVNRKVIHVIYRK